MDRANLLSRVVILTAVGLLAGSLIAGTDEQIRASQVLFWVLLLIGAELLPVSLGYETQVTMAFPIVLAISILYEPGTAMLISGLGTIDIREFRREIPIEQGLFNRAQTMLTAGAGSFVVHLFEGNPFSFPFGALVLIGAAVALLVTNLALVALYLTQVRRISLRETFDSLIPRPAGGFWASQSLIASLGIATAAAYRTAGAFVAAFLIPLLFARLGILGARAQQELSERLRKQQEALLAASEQVFREREDERKRIAADIHDSSLQLLAAAHYGVDNAKDYFRAGNEEEAHRLLDTTAEAIDDAIKGLRASLVDLRRSSVESGGLMETIRAYVDQVSMLWGTEVVIDGEIEREPPAPVALAAFQILQEGLVNALKHAGSEPIRVRVLDKDNMVHIVVEDDGPGFDPEAEVGSDHVGMRLMKERAALVGGRIELTSSEGAGTRLEAVLPGGVAS